MTLSSPTILVTGANGFIGRHVVEELRTQGESVLGIDHVDVDLAEATYPLPDTIQTIYHFAGRIWGDESLEQTILDHVVEMAVQCSAERIVYASSCSVYGQNEMDCKTDEAVATAPFSPYAKGKLLGEEKLRACPVATTVLRFFNPYGPGQFEKMAVPAMINKAKQGQTLEIFGDGTQMRDFIYIRDMAKASIAAAKVGSAFEIFNVGSGVETSVNDLAGAVIKATGSVSRIDHLAVPEERQNLEVSYRVADITKLTSLSGWKPTVSLADGLARVVAEMG